jgi:phosphate binding protein
VKASENIGNPKPEMTKSLRSERRGIMRRITWIALLLVLALVVAACAGQTAAPTATPAPAAPAPAEPTAAPAEESDDEDMADEDMADDAAEEAMPADGPIVLPEINPLELSVDIIIMGSSTVYPLTEAMAERFYDEGFGGRITIDSIGSGAGYERFCVAGESDIANASRPIRDSEVANCQSIGREPIEIRVGTDALAVVVHPDNDWLTDVSIEELALIFSDEVVNWNEVNEAYPDMPILRFSPGTDSGTYDYFVEEVMDARYGDEGEARILNSRNLQLSEDDNVLVQGVEGELGAIGYFGYAYYEENVGRLAILDIEGVEGTAESVDAGTYPLARPLFIYTTASIMQEKPQVAAFVNFYLTYVEEEVERVGYFPASAAAYNGARQAWLEAMGE